MTLNSNLREPDAMKTNYQDYDSWVLARVQESLNDPRPALSHHRVMSEAQELIDQKRRSRIACGDT